MIAALALAGNPALAHSFNVALVIALSGDAEAGGRQVLAGFMLATAERDSHPDQESDGHLGGLDVYVTVIDGSGDIAGAVRHAATQGQADIVVSFGSETMPPETGGPVEGAKAVIPPPGQPPFASPGSPGVAAFIAAYQGAHGARPSASAARGYNAARRIDAAVRAQGGTRETDLLRRHFEGTVHDFTW